MKTLYNQYAFCYIRLAKDNNYLLEKKKIKKKSWKRD
jgi:hypothetical protein